MKENFQEATLERIKYFLVVVTLLASVYGIVTKGLSRTLLTIFLMLVGSHFILGMLGDKEIAVGALNFGPKDPLLLRCAVLFLGVFMVLGGIYQLISN